MGSVWPGFVPLSCIVQGLLDSDMDNPDWKEIHRILRRHEEITQANSSALMHISSKITELEQAHVTNITNIMNLLLIQKQQIDSLEVEGNRLHSLVLPQRLDSLSLASNNHSYRNLLQANLREDKTVGQNHDPMEVEELGSPHSAEGQGAQDSVHP
jgi:hypothetical protein